MNIQELSTKLLEGLVELEQSGDLVITSTTVSSLAERLSNKIVTAWAKEFAQYPPSEIVIEDWFASCSWHLQEMFGLAEADARATTEKFYGKLTAGRPLREVADLVAHQGGHETAMGAYYSIYLQLGEYYSSGYIDWRADMQMKTPAGK